MVQANEVIELSELRIGNILTYDGRFVYVTSLSMDIDDEYEDQIHFCYVGESSNEKGGWNRSIADKLKRVALTPELLEKTNLKYSEGFDGVKGWKIAPYVWLSRLTETKWYVGFEETDNSQSHQLTQVSEVFKYLHQLQNLYFALTGEELEVNL